MEGIRQRMRFPERMVLAVALLISGCSAGRKTAVKPAQTPVPLQTATKADLIARYDQQADAIDSLNAAVTLRLTAGSAYTGVIEQYHEVSGFILAQKPADIRVIGQVPVVGKDIFDMESDGKTFHIFVPSKNQFITGPADLERASAKPIENLRPQHLIDAIFWRPISPQDLVLLEEAQSASSNFYVLTVARAGSGNATNTDTGASLDWEISRKVWFDRRDLSVAQIQIFETGGILASDVQYNGWDTFGAVRYPRQILLVRPLDDYRLQIGIVRLTANERVPPERFVLQQPPGTELVRVDEGPKR